MLFPSAGICPIFLQCLSVHSVVCSGLFSLALHSLLPHAWEWNHSSVTDWLIHFIFTTKSMRSLLCTLAVLGLLCFFQFPNFIVLIKLSHILTYLLLSHFHDDNTSMNMNEWERKGAHLPFFYIVLKVLIKKDKVLSLCIYDMYGKLIFICHLNLFFFKITNIAEIHK